MEVLEALWKTARTWTSGKTATVLRLMSNTSAECSIKSWFWMIAQTCSFPCTVLTCFTTLAPRTPWAPHSVNLIKK